MKKKKIITCCLLILAVTICSVFVAKHIKNSNTHIETSSRVVTDSSNTQEDNKSNQNSNDSKDNKNVKGDKDSKEDKKDADKSLAGSSEQKSKEQKSETADSNKTSSKGTPKTSASDAFSVSPENKDKTSHSDVTVYMRIEGYDKTFAPRTKITTRIFDLNPYLGRATGSSATPSNGWGADKFKEPTVAHATVKLLEQKGYKHSTGYDLQDYGWSLYIAMIGGNREFDYRSTSGWMYRVNDVLPNVGCQAKPIKGGEEILWYFGAYGFDTLVTEMSASAQNINAGESVTVTLNGIKNDIKTWKEYREPAQGATIYSNGSPLSVNGKNVVTDKSGKAVIKFAKRGTYKLSAERVDAKGLKDLLRPQPVTINVK